MHDLVHALPVDFKCHDVNTKLSMMLTFWIFPEIMFETRECTPT